MTPLKDTLEATAPTTETAATQTNERKADAGQLRADAVSLDVPVKVHGSRIKEVVLGTTPHTEPFEEQTATLIVFPQGGVVRMSTAVTAGQMVVLTNLKSGHDAICRVVKVRACPPTQSYVEIEFTHRQPGYWGVYFPSDEPQMEQQIAPSPMPAVTYVAPPVSVAIKVEQTEKNAALSGSGTPATTLRTPAPSVAPVSQIAQPVKAESPFVSIGAQEDVQPAAASTTRGHAGPFPGIERPRTVADTSKKSTAVDFPQAASNASFSMSDLQGDTHAAPSISFSGAGVPSEGEPEVSNVVSDSPVDNASPPFERFAATASLSGSRAAQREPFGSDLVSGMGIDNHPAEIDPIGTKSQGRNWVLIAASAAALFLVAAGAAFYFHWGPFAADFGTNSATSSAAARAVAPPAPAVDTSASAGQNSSAGSAQQVNSAQPAAAVAPSVTARGTQTPPPGALKTSSAAETPSSASAKQKTAPHVPEMFVGLNAHPVSSERAPGSGDADSAPSVDAGTTSDAANNGLQGVAGSSVEVPKPVAPPPAPVRIGGQIKPPRLIYSVLPIYPTVAKGAGIEGDVVVDTSIDKTGRVIATKIVSGPPMLRQAAIDALRQWKYEPSLLNGEPIDTQTVVTIRFHR
jgi:protein TonB